MLLTPDAYPWMSQARCTAEDPELFFPRTLEEERAAKAVCATCPVLNDCREHVLALAAEQPVEGVWAAMTTADRNREMRLLDTTRCGTREGHAQHRRLKELPCRRCRAWWANEERKRHRAEVAS
jgi:WhiB family transcriptional regulator, redox-sensing transcriptional regulator